MNILIIDDGLSPAKSEHAPFGREAFARICEENLFRHRAFAAEAARLSDNLLFIRAVLEPMAEDAGIFEFRTCEGVSELIIRVPPGRSRALPLKGLFEFYSLLSENAPGIAGLFEPDAVICGGALPLGIFAAAKMARLSGAVLITEFCCSPEKILKRLRLSGGSFWLTAVLKKAAALAFEKSEAVIGLYPEFFREYTGHKNALQMLPPAHPLPKEPSNEAKLLRSSLEALAEGGIFTLCFCGKLERGRSLEELIRAAGDLDRRFSLMLIGSGDFKISLRRTAREAGVTNVTFLDEIPPEDFSFALSAAGAVFVSEQAELRGLGAEGGEFFASLAAGRPVLAAAEKHAEFFKNAGAITVRPGDKNEISNGIKALFDMNTEEREILGRRAAGFAERHLPRPFAAGFRSAIENFVKQKEIL